MLLTEPCDSDPCLFEANCTDGATPDTYTCECPVNSLGQEVFEGVNCQERTDIDLCSGAQCDECVPDYSNIEPMCLCQPGEESGQVKAFNIGKFLALFQHNVSAILRVLSSIQTMLTYL